MVLQLKQRKAQDLGTDSTIDRAGIVRGVVEEIRTNGDKAVRAYSEKFDNWSPDSFKLSPEEIKEIIAKVPQQIIDDIKEAQENVRVFALAQRDSIKDFEVETKPGVFLGQKSIPIQTVGA